MADNQTNPPKVSQLHVHSFGVVAENMSIANDANGKPNKIVEVHPVEDFPTTSGTITDNATQYQATGVDANGKSYNESITQTITVKAEWLPFGSNRMNPPNVRRGERVMLWRFGDSDKYYWATMLDDMNLRKLETVVYAWSGTSDESVDTDASTSYFFEVSTHNKLMHLHTSNANGEVCVYDIQVNPGTGVIQMQDDIGNSFLLDSINLILQMQNADGTVLSINKKNMTIVVPETWQVQAKNGVFVFTEGWNIQSKVTNHQGDFNELGALGLSGDMVTAASGGVGPGTPGTGKIKIAGAAELIGSLDVKGPVSAVTIEATESITAPNLQYN